MSSLGISPLRGIQPAVTSFATPETAAKSGPVGGASFTDLLQNAIQSTSHAENQAQSAISRSVAGDDLTEIEVLSAVKKADLSLRLMLQVRNTLLQAYDELKQMQF